MNTAPLLAELDRCVAEGALFHRTGPRTERARLHVREVERFLEPCERIMVAVREVKGAETEAGHTAQQVLDLFAAMKYELYNRADL